MKFSCMKCFLLSAGIAILGAAPAWSANVKLPLRDLADRELILRCVTDQQTLQVPLPERWSVKGASLRLRYDVSGNLARENSQLMIKMNDRLLAQIRLNPQSQDEFVDVPIPAGAMQPGYNRLTLESIQHVTTPSRQQCEGPCPPDLWVKIDAKESFVQMDYEALPVPLDLSKLAGFVFDPKLSPTALVHIVTEDLSEQSANPAAMVASGIARRFDYRQVSFSVSRELRAGTDNVIVGKLAYVTRFLAQRGVKLPPADGAYLKLLALPGADGRPDASRALLVVTGASDEAVKIAAMTFSSISFPFPGSDELKAFQFVLPDLTQYSGREVLASDRPYALSTLNFPTQTSRGVNSETFRGKTSGPGRLSFRLPVDFHVRPSQYAALTLNFSYSSGLRSDSALSVAVNGSGVRAIPLSNAEGAYLEGYKINIPTHLFKPGLNTLDLNPILKLPGQICDLIQPDGMFLTIYGNSTFEFPAMPHVIEMPKLELFTYNGFPVTRWPDGHQATVLLAEKDDRVLAAALNVLGMISQKNGFPLFGLQLSYAPRAEGELIAIGAIAKLPEALRKAAPIQVDGTMTTVPYPIIRSWQEEVSIAYSRQTGTLGPGRGLLMQFQSPFENGRTVVIITASDNDDLVEVSRELLEPVVQAQSRGDVMLIEFAKPESKVSTLDTGKHYMTGKAGAAMTIESYLFTRPALHYAILVAILVLVSAAIYVYLRRRRARKAE